MFRDANGQYGSQVRRTAHQHTTAATFPPDQLMPKAPQGGGRWLASSALPAAGSQATDILMIYGARRPTAPAGEQSISGSAPPPTPNVTSNGLPRSVMDGAS